MRSNLIVEVTTRADMRTVNTGCTDREINGESESFLSRAWISAHLNRAVICLHKLERCWCDRAHQTQTHVQTSRLRSYARYLMLHIPTSVRATSPLFRLQWGKAFIKKTNNDWKKLYLFAWTFSSSSSWTCIWLGCSGPMPWCSDFGELVQLDVSEVALLQLRTRNAPGISASPYSVSHSSNTLLITS